jgi:hypothetical protein
MIARPRVARGVILPDHRNPTFPHHRHVVLLPWFLRWVLSSGHPCPILSSLMCTSFPWCYRCTWSHHRPLEASQRRRASSPRTESATSSSPHLYSEVPPLPPCLAGESCPMGFHTMNLTTPRPSVDHQQARHYMARERGDHTGYASRRAGRSWPLKPFLAIGWAIPVGRYGL